MKPKKSKDLRVTKLASFTEFNPCPVVEINLNGTVTYINPAGRRLFPDLQEVGLKHLYLADIGLIAAELREKGTTSCEREIRAGDAWYKQVLQYIETEHSMRVYGFDFTERRRTEEALILSRNQIEAVTQIGAMANSTLDISEVLNHILMGTLEAAGASAGMIFLRDEDTGCFEWGASHGLSEAFEEAFRDQGIKPGEGLTGLVAQTGEPIYIEEDSSNDPRIVRPVIKAEGLNSFIGVPVYAADNIVAVMNIVTRPPDFLREEKISLIKAIGTHVGLAIRNARLFKERKKAEENLWTTLESIGDGFFTCDREWRFVYVNAPAEHILGIRREEVLGRSHWEVFPLTLGTNLEREYRRAAAGESRDFENFYEPWGRWFHNRCFPREGGGMSVYIQDITARKKAEEALTVSEAKYRATIETTTDGYWLVDTEGRILEINDSYSRQSGYSRKELLGMRIMDLEAVESPEETAARIRKIMRKGNDIFESRHRTKDGRIWDVEINVIYWPSAGGQFFALSRDITARKKAEGELGKYRAHLEELVEQRTRELAVLNEQLQQSQNMEAVGLLAGGIAHEFNNILATIKGSIHLILKKLQADNPVIKYAEQISLSINKASSLCHDLLAFSRKQTITLRPVDFNGIIHMGTKLLSPIIGEDIEMTIVLTDKKPAVMADINQIEQVLLNLATNAQDAMPDGGRLTIRTEIIDMDEEFRKRHGYGVSGRYVLLSVSDTGKGMEEEVKEKIYEPFFTTKELGKGSGLGLAVTYGIVKQHNGFIDVETAPGKGTTFKLYLPAVEAKAVQQESRDVTSATEGIETILLAEDDHDARETMSEVLRLSGYAVLEAGDGESAVKVFMEKKDQIDLVFLDVRMPKKNGREVYEEIKKESREIAVLFMSGYTKDIIDSQGIIEEKLNFISKTATTEEILRKIREVLDK